MKNKAKILVNQGFGVYSGKSKNTDFHQHHAIQIGFTLQGRYSLHIKDEIYEGSNFIINSNVSHRHNSIDGIHISVFIDPETEIGCLLMNKFKEDFHQFTASSAIVQEISNEIYKNNPSILNISNLITQLFGLEPIVRTNDARIDDLIQQITTRDIENIDIKNLMQNIPLSSSRIRHLFKKQTGISIQRYILWTKIKKAFFHLSKNENLSQASYLSGFSDYAHLSRTIKEMFGLNLKTILKDSHYVQDL